MWGLVGELGQGPDVRNRMVRPKESSGLSPYRLLGRAHVAVAGQPGPGYPGRPHACGPEGPGTVPPHHFGGLAVLESGMERHLGLDDTVLRSAIQILTLFSSKTEMHGVYCTKNTGRKYCQRVFFELRNNQSFIPLSQASQRWR